MVLVLWPLILFPDYSLGVIRTTEVLDREAAPLYWLLVYATDLGAEPLTSWTHVLVEVLDINDNPPELSQPVYFASVLENVVQVRSVVQVSACDADASSHGMLSYHMAESFRNYFEVDPRTGNTEWKSTNLLLWSQNFPPCGNLSSLI